MKLLLVLIMLVPFATFTRAQCPSGSSEEFSVNSARTWKEIVNHKCKYKGDNCAYAITADVADIMWDGSCDIIQFELHLVSVSTDLDGQIEDADFNADPTISLGEITIPGDRLGIDDDLNVNIEDAPYDHTTSIVTVIL